MRRLGGLFVVALLFGALFFVAGSAHAQDGRLTLRLGQEADSNPGRSESGTTAPDTATRLVVSGEGSWRHEDLRVDTSGLVGARAFANASDSDSVVVIGALSGSYLAHPLLSARLSLGLRDTTERRRGRDFTLLNAGGSARLGNSTVGLRVDAGGQRFHYKPDSDFGWFGPRAGVTTDYRLSDLFRLTLGGEWARRVFSRIDLGAAGRRLDTVLTLRSGVDAHWNWGTVEVGYSFANTRSNNEARNIVRHVVSPSVTAVPFGELLVRVSATIQRARCAGNCVLDEFDRADEETRNRMTIALEHPLGTAWLWGEFRYTWFSQAFGEGQTGVFRRHLGYVGLAIRQQTRE
ncbi:MAG: hypothetical protein ACI81R_002676 [Bradymonadia bacterium]